MFPYVGVVRCFHVTFSIKVVAPANAIMYNKHKNFVLNILAEFANFKRDHLKHITNRRKKYKT